MVAIGYGLYFTAVAGLFLWTRSRTWTEAEAMPPADKQPGFGSKISLAAAAKGMFRFWGPRVLVVTCAISLIARIVVGQSGWQDLAVVASVIVMWPIQEWLIHAWLEHRPPIQIGNRKMELLITKTHRAHHRNPWDPKYGLTTTYFVIGFLGCVPLLWSIPYQIGWLPLGAVMSGNLITFLLILNYEWIHYLIHTSYVPKGRLYRRLWRNHRLHHFQNENFWYGLTMLGGDRLLGTQPTKSLAGRSDTVMNLGVDIQTADTLVESGPPQQ
ncbi:Fatty acid hydroxylase superfamily protein [Rubripirellula lacrimiformis]|uniref:Fatty acid hydroxylase superfamily protein n=1 Tax=Rubripirellula lacrimiformis TaxID=1930273 RepID=A0A517N771_9BACT|nr:sterol desaturase family protein [Rubripirellula lacrimiformis]QDT02999.1 Fatty acid hydroxylase superfamily protein [Rubripirellula lacrimiformis]